MMQLQKYQFNSNRTCNVLNMQDSWDRKGETRSGCQEEEPLFTVS